MPGSVWEPSLHPRLLPHLGPSDFCSDSPRRLEAGEGSRGKRKEDTIIVVLLHFK